MRISIVMPAYNEEKRIGQTLESYGKYFEDLKKSKGLDCQILVVINATTDNTKKVVREYMDRFKEIDFLNLEKGGKGYAVVEGFKHELGKKRDLIGFVDADGATSPEEFYKLVNQIRENDCAIASRWLAESKVETKQTLTRRITSRTFNFIVRSLFGMPFRDTQCGAKVWKKEALSSIINKIGNTAWAFDIDLLYHTIKHGYNIIEIPTVWEDKKETKLNLTKVPLQMFSGVLRLRIINSPFSFIIKIYDSLPEELKIHHKLTVK